MSHLEHGGRESATKAPGRQQQGADAQPRRALHERSSFNVAELPTQTGAEQQLTTAHPRRQLGLLEHVNRANRRGQSRRSRFDGRAQQRLEGQGVQKGQDSRHRDADYR